MDGGSSRSEHEVLEAASLAAAGGMWQVLAEPGGGPGVPASLLHHHHHPHLNGGSLLHPGAANLVAATSPQQQQSSLNMMIQGGQGLIPAHAALSNTSNSNSLSGATQYLLLGPHGVDPNNLSPGSNGAAGGMGPPPSVTPPSHALEMGGDRVWPNNQSLFLASLFPGSQMLGPEALASPKALEEAAHAARLKQASQMSQQQQGGGGNPSMQAQQQGQQMGGQMGNDYGGIPLQTQLESLHGLGRPALIEIPPSPRYNPSYNPYADMRSLPPNASPPISAGVLRPMPPRPRPEGGQEQSSGFESLNTGKDEFSIGPWDEDGGGGGEQTTGQPPPPHHPMPPHHPHILKSPPQQQISNQQPMNILPPQFNTPFYISQKLMEESNGSNKPQQNPYEEQQQAAAMNYGPPPPHHPHELNSTSLWPPPHMILPPPQQQQAFRQHHQRGGGNNGCSGSLRGTRRKPQSRPERPSSDHMQEKRDGKKSAIEETIAMMSKMKMEDKERARAAGEAKPDILGAPPSVNANPQYNNRRLNNSNNNYHKNDGSGNNNGYRGGNYRGGRGGRSSSQRGGTNNNAAPFYPQQQPHIQQQQQPQQSFHTTLSAAAGFFPMRAANMEGLLAHQGIYPGSYPNGGGSPIIRGGFVPPVMRPYRGAGLYRGPPPLLLGGQQQQQPRNRPPLTHDKQRRMMASRPPFYKGPPPALEGGEEMILYAQAVNDKAVEEDGGPEEAEEQISEEVCIEGMSTNEPSVETDCSNNEEESTANGSSPTMAEGTGVSDELGRKLPEAAGLTSSHVSAVED